MKTGVTAVALAASALLITTPANAQEGVRVDRSVPGLQLRSGADVTLRGGNAQTVSLVRNDSRRRGDRSRNDRRRDDRGRRNVRLNDYGQTRQEVQHLADRAIYACACQLEIDAHKYGFEDGAFRSTPHYEQVGPNKFVVKGTAKLFDGYDYSRQSYDCVVRRGSIRNASNLYPVKYRDRGQHNRRDRFNNSFGSNGFSFSFGNRR